MIIMTYYPQGNMVDTFIPDEIQRMSGFGQVLEALGHLHEKGIRPMGRITEGSAKSLQ